MNELANSFSVVSLGKEAALAASPNTVIDEQPAHGTSIDDLSDDDLSLIVCVLKRQNAVLPFALTCRRWRRVQQLASVTLKTGLPAVASSMRMLSWANAIGCPYPTVLKTDVLCRAAAEHNAVDVLNFALEHGCPLEQCRLFQGPEKPWTDLGTIRRAAEFGHVEFIQAARAAGCEWGKYPMRDAAANGHVACIRRMHEMGCPINEDVCVASAARGRIACLELLSELGAPMARACEGAAEFGGVSVLAKAHALGGELSSAVVATILDEFPREGLDDPVFKWAIEHGCSLEGISGERAGWIWCSAVWESNFETVQLLHQRGLPAHPWAIPVVIETFPQELAKVEWLVERGFPISGRAMYAASLLGGDDLGLMEYLDAKGGRASWQDFQVDEDNDDFPCDDNRSWSVSGCGDAAIESGSIPKFEWVIARAPDAWFSGRATATASHTGNREMLKHLIEEHGCEWFRCECSSVGTTLTVAMESDEIRKPLDEMLRFCVELGAPLTLADFVSAAKLNHITDSFEIMEWLLEQKCASGPTVCAAAAATQIQMWTRKDAVHQGLSGERLDELMCGTPPGTKLNLPLAKVKWLRSRGISWDVGTTTAAAKHGNLELLEWASENYCIFNADTMDAAVASGQLKVMRWLHAHGCPIGPKSTTCAAENGEQEALAWLIDKNAPCDIGAFFSQVRQAHAAAKNKALKNKNNAAYRRLVSVGEFLAELKRRPAPPSRVEIPPSRVETPPSRA
jgi:hypothetical protein